MSQPASLGTILSWLRLYRTENIGPLTFRNLLAKYTTAQAALEALPYLANKTGKRRLLIPSSSKIQEEYDTMVALGGHWITWRCPTYPSLLAELPDSPPILSVRGQALSDRKPSISIVGARNGSLASRHFTNDLAHTLGQHGFTIVSGFARGIDTAAHQGALSTGTIGILAGGIDHIYPPENKNLYHAILETGSILAESPLHATPQARHFPKRNRLIAGFSQALVVIEAAKYSGSLITARFAGDQGREVFAVPGSPQDPRCAGTNQLLKDGATLLTAPEDIMQTLRKITPQRKDTYVSSPLEEKAEKSSDEVYNKILNALSAAPMSCDALIRACHISTQTLQNTLLELEIGGRLARLTCGKVCLIK